MGAPFAIEIIIGITLYAPVGFSSLGVRRSRLMGS